MYHYIALYISHNCLPDSVSAHHGELFLWYNWNPHKSTFDLYKTLSHGGNFCPCDKILSIVTSSLYNASIILHIIVFQGVKGLVAWTAPLLMTLYSPSSLVPLVTILYLNFTVQKTYKYVIFHVTCSPIYTSIDGVNVSCWVL